MSRVTVVPMGKRRCVIPGDSIQTVGASVRLKDIELPVCKLLFAKQEARQLIVQQGQAC